MDRPPLQDIDIDAALRTILEGTATETGAEFFKALVKNLAAALNTQGAWVTEYFPESRRLKALAFWMGGQWLDGWEMVVDGTPCERVIDERCLIHIRESSRHDGVAPTAYAGARVLAMPLLTLTQDSAISRCSYAAPAGEPRTHRCSIFSRPRRRQLPGCAPRRGPRREQKAAVWSARMDSITS